MELRLNAYPHATPFFLLSLASAFLFDYIAFKLESLCYDER